MQRTGILPVGTHLETSKGYKLNVKQWLTEGSTAYIYTAAMKDDETSRDVIIKLAKPEKNSVIEDELSVLDRLREHYVVEQSKDIPVTPWLWDGGQHNNHKFIVMEYVKAQPPLDWFLAGTRFSESQVLSLAMELYELLDYLHTGLKRAYTDFKLDNVRLERNGGADFRLRLLDVGGLIKDPDSFRLRDDVLMAASHLFTLTAGYELRLFGGEVTDDIEKAFAHKPFLSDISWGTQQLFCRLLCRAPEFRISAAAEAAKGARDLHSWWSIDETALLTRATESFNQAQGTALIKDKNQGAARARMQMDIFVRRDNKQTLGSEDLLRQIESAYEGSSYLDQGKDNLQLGEYDAALSNFREGEALEAKPALFRRWRCAALALKQLRDPSLLGRVDEIVQLFERKRYEEASGRLAELPDASNWQMLKNEAEIYARYQAGFECERERNYADAADEFTQVKELLNRAPEEDQKTIRRTEGDPQTFIDRCDKFLEEEQSQGRYDKEYHSIEGQLSSGVLPRSEIQELATRYRYSPYLAEDAVEIVKMALEKLKREEVYFAANTLYWSLAEKSSQLQQGYGLCRDLMEAASLLNLGVPMGPPGPVNDENLKAETSRSAALSLLTNLAGMATMTIFGGINWQIYNLLDDWITGHVNDDLVTDDPIVWSTLEHLVDKLSIPASYPEMKVGVLKTNISKRCSDIEAARQKSLRELLGQIKMLLYLPQPGKFTREKAWEYIRSFSVPEANLLFKQASGRLKILDMYIAQAEEIALSDEVFVTLRDELSKLRKEFEDQRRTLVRSKANLGNPILLDNLQQHWKALGQVNTQLPESAKETFQLLDECLMYVLYEGLEDESILKIIRDCYQKIAQVRPEDWGWKALKEFRSTRLQDELARLANIKNQFETGHVDAAWESYRTLSPEIRVTNNGLDLYLRMLQTKELLAWADTNSVSLKLKVLRPDFSAKLESYAKLERELRIPPIYFEHHDAIAAYLQKNSNLAERLGVKKRQELEPPKQNPLLRWGLIAFVIIMLSAGGFGLWQNWPAIIPMFYAPTATTAPAITPTVTAMPTTTATFEPTLVPTLLPASKHLLADSDPSNLANLDDKTSLLKPANYPKLPVKSMNSWKLDQAFAQCSNDPEKYCAQMDVPLAAGQYALYIYNDTQLFNTPQPNLKVQVFLQDATAPVMPSQGLGQFQYGTPLEINSLSAPIPDLWLWVGNYPIGQTGTLRIEVSYADKGDGQISDKTMKSILNTILWLQVDEAQWNKLPPVPDGYELTSILDNTNSYGVITVKGNKQWNLLPTKSLQTSDAAWNGDYYDVSQAIFVGSGVLQAGTYEVYYHFVDQKSSGTLRVRSSGVVLMNKDFDDPGTQQWADFGSFALDKAAQPAIAINGAGGTAIPVDAILIYKKTQ